ncbi:hypothetical protein GCM10009840_10830 [Pseudolysinimonas kribbensis]|uniref:hypothetical protein n=1 Tax=Pseudolysinimonas kribbensis TaxID=433641 RepID=UPI0031CDBD89
MSARSARLPAAVGAGVAATVVMSAYMLGGESREAIGTAPPARIVARLRPGWSAEQVSAAGTALHLGIGASGGVLAVLLRRFGPPSSLPAAVILWLVGYEVIAPALGVLPPAHRDGERARHLFRAHLVYGAALMLLRRVR